jgi:hypothetical protein
MVDEVATTALVFDNTGAKAGADAFQAAAEKILAANNAIGQSFKNATDRVVTGTDAQTRALANAARQVDPFIAAMARAQRQVETLQGIMAIGMRSGASTKEIEQAAQAADLLTAATARLNVVRANQSFANAAASGFAQMGAQISFVAGSADVLSARMESLRGELNGAVGNIGQYAGAWDRVSSSMDVYVAQATRASAVTTDQIVQAKLAQDALNSQMNINQLTNVQTSPGSVGGVAVSPYKSAPDSAAVFQAQYDVEDKLAAENARLMATYPSLASATAAHRKVLDDLTLAVSRNLMTEQEAAKIRDQSAAGLAHFGESMSGAETHTRATTMAIRETTNVFRDMALGMSPLEIALLNFGRFEHTFESFGAIVKQALSFLASGPGIALEVVAAFGTLAFTAETSARRIEALRNELSLVRDDFMAVSAAAAETASHLAGTSTISTTDARAGVNAVSAVPGFVGTPAQIETIVKAFADLSTAQGKAALDSKQLGEAMRDPTAFLTQMEPLLKTVDSNLVEHAKLLQGAGDKAGAFALALKAVQDGTSAVQHNLTPLEEAYRHLQQTMSGSGSGGRGWIQELGTIFDDIIAREIRGIDNIIAALERVKAWGDAHGFGLGTPGGSLPSGMVPTTSYGGVAGGAQPATYGGTLGPYDPMLYGNYTGPRTSTGAGAGAIPGDIAPLISAAATAVGLDTAALAQLYRQEAVRNQDGSFQTSSAGARGPLQVMPGTYASVAGQYGVSGGIDNTASNIQVGALYFRDLIKQFAAAGYGPDVAAGAYNMGPGNAAKGTGMLGVLAGTRDLPAETAKYMRDFQSGYGSSGGLASPGSPANGNIGFPEGGPTGAPGTGTGLGNVTKDYQKIANDLSNSTPEARVAALTSSLKDLDKALANDPGNQKWLQEKQLLTLELYKAVPALTATGRAMDMQTKGSLDAAAAWDKGALAASNSTITLKAQTEALQFAKPGTMEYGVAVAILTEKLTAQTVAEEALKVAQQNDQTKQLIDYTQKEIDTINMEVGARDVLLAQYKALQVLQKDDSQLLAATDAASVARVKTTLAQAAANATVTDSYKLMTANMNEAASMVDQTFTTLGTSIVDSFTNGKTAAQNFSDTMTTISKAILNEFLKLAVINPLMNSLFPGTPTRPDLTGVTNALNAPTPAAAAGSTTSAVNGSASTLSSLSNLDFSSAYSGSWLQSIFGGGTPAAAAVAHSGWLVGSTPMASRYVHPAYFYDAPRLHQGLASDEFPAILQKGERVLTANQDNRVLELVSRLSAQVNSGGMAGTGQTNSAPSPTQKDAFFKILAHGENVLNAHRYHAGGVVGLDGVPASISSGYFLGAPRFHTGTTTLTDGTVVPTDPTVPLAGSDVQFTGTPAIQSAADALKSSLGVIGTRLPSGGASVAGAPMNWNAPAASSSASSPLLASLGSLALPIGMLLIKSGLFSGSGVAAGTSNTSAAAGDWGSWTGLTNTTAGGGFVDAGTWGAGAGAGSAVGAGIAADATTGALASTADLTAASGLFATGSTGGMALAGTFHQGGLVGFDAGMSRRIHPSYFDSAPRFHTGSALGSALGGDEFAAILQKGERVLTQRQQGQVAAAANSADGGGTHFHGDIVINPPPGADKKAMDSFGRSMPGMLRQALTVQMRAASRNS